MTFFVKIPLLHFEMLNLIGQQPVRQIIIGLQIIRMGDVLKGHAIEFFLGVPEDPTQRPVHLQPGTICPHDGHANRRVLKGSRKPLLAQAQFPLPFLPLCDVLRDAHHLQGTLRFRVLENLHLLMHMTHPAVR